MTFQTKINDRNKIFTLNEKELKAAKKAKANGEKFYISRTVDKVANCKIAVPMERI